MKQFFKTFGIGVEFLLMSGFAVAYGYVSFVGFCSVSTAIGWEAFVHVFAAFSTGVISLFTVYFLGLIPTSTINYLKAKIAELEDTEDDH